MANARDAASTTVKAGANTDRSSNESDSVDAAHARWQGVARVAASRAVHRPGHARCREVEGARRRPGSRTTRLARAFSQPTEVNRSTLGIEAPFPPKQEGGVGAQ